MTYSRDIHGVETRKGTTVVVDVAAFLEAFRDAGYRGLGGALAELVDNSLEARATRVDVEFRVFDGVVDRVSVLDDGCGIDPAELTTALQLGGSTRFDSRAGFGRYGIGLPGSSISQARRVDVYSWTGGEVPWWTYLALDSIRSGGLVTIPRAKRASPPFELPAWASPQGTLVTWSLCDRIPRVTKWSLGALRLTLGRTFREAIWGGRAIRVDGEPLVAVDPLYLREGIAPAGAKPYGPSLSFDVDLPGRGRRRRAQVTARFSELPIEKWESLSNSAKRRMGISKGSGISILRADREIDCGWFFMGEKRRESYDDWWRCEVSFSPELDEFFGVTHTKQGIHPSETLRHLLTPELSRVAHVLNARVRSRFRRLRAARPRQGRAVRTAERRDYLLEPPKGTTTPQVDSVAFRGLRYEVAHDNLPGPQFFRQEQRKDLLRLVFNRTHPFHSAVFTEDRRVVGVDVVELLLLAAARAERRLASARDRAALARHREHWSNALAAFFA